MDAILDNLPGHTLSRQEQKDVFLALYMAKGLLQDFGHLPVPGSRDRRPISERPEYQEIERLAKLFSETNPNILCGCGRPVNLRCAPLLTTDEADAEVGIQHEA